MRNCESARSAAKQTRHDSQLSPMGIDSALDAGARVMTPTLRGVGICVDPTGLWTSTAEVTPAGSSKQIIQSAATIPPSSLLPRLPAETVRLDTNFPCHPRATGDLWPPE